MHELDLKDGKFARPEAAGIGRLLAGIVAGEPTRRGRLERGFALFDDLYRSFAAAGSPSGEKAGSERSGARALVP